MRGLAFRLTADRHRMDDALQEAYLKAYRGLPTFRPGSDFGRGLPHHLQRVIDEIRRRRRHPVTTADPSIPSPPGPDPSASSAHRRPCAPRGRPPHRPARHRVLVDGEGFDHREVAKILGVTPGTVASRLHRARRALRRILGEEVG